MKATTYSVSCPASQMDGIQRKEIALGAIIKEQPISHIAKEQEVSRKFVYAQKGKAISAIDDAFTKEEEKDKVLFYLPVTKQWLYQLILMLVLYCHGSFRGVSKVLDDAFDYQVSIATISNVIQEAKYKAVKINNKQDLSNIKLGAQDEMFHHNKPVLTGVDIRSLYCYLLAQEQQRDGDTWAIHLWDLQEQGFNPERVIADNGDGLHAGMGIALPHIPCDGDNFHIIKDLTELRRFFRNQLKTATTHLKKMEDKMNQAKQLGTSYKHAHKLGIARKHEAKMRFISETVDTIVSWMAHDVLNKAGPNPDVRRELFDFIVDELRNLEQLHSHRIRSMRIALQNQKELLLAFTDVLDRKFQLIAERFYYPLDIIWQMCELQRCKYAGDTYAIRSVPLVLLLEDRFDLIEDAVLQALDSTERTSSMVENLNSRLSPYFFLRREIGSNYLELLRFFLNHTSFLRSSNPNRVGKTPTEILTSQKHSHWVEMLGFNLFRRNA